MDGVAHLHEPISNCVRRDAGLAVRLDENRPGRDSQAVQDLQLGALAVEFKDVTLRKVRGQDPVGVAGVPVDVLSGGHDRVADVTAVRDAVVRDRLPDGPDLLGAALEDGHSPFGTGLSCGDHRSHTESPTDDYYVVTWPDTLAKPGNEWILVAWFVGVRLFLDDDAVVPRG